MIISPHLSLRAALAAILALLMGRNRPTYLFLVMVFVAIALAVAMSSGCKPATTPEPPTAAPSSSPTTTGRTPVSAIALPDEATPPLPSLEPPLSDFFGIIRSGRPDVARVRLRRHLDQHPADGQAEFLFGLTYHEEKQYDEAVKWFDLAVQHAPSYPITNYFRGWALYYLGRTDEARDSFAKHLDVQPREADSHFALGLIALDADDLEEAERRFRTAIAVSEGVDSRVAVLSKSLARLADVQVQHGEYEEARAGLERATTLHPDHYEAFYKLSRVYTRLGEDDAADEARRMFESTRDRIRPGTAFPE